MRSPYRRQRATETRRQHATETSPQHATETSPQHATETRPQHATETRPQHSSSRPMPTAPSTVSAPLESRYGPTEHSPVPSSSRTGEQNQPKTSSRRDRPPHRPYFNPGLIPQEREMGGLTPYRLTAYGQEAPPEYSLAIRGDNRRYNNTLSVPPRNTRVAIVIPSAPPGDDAANLHPSYDTINTDSRRTPVVPQHSQYQTIGPPPSYEEVVQRDHSIYLAGGLDG